MTTRIIECSEGQEYALVYEVSEHLLDFRAYAVMGWDAEENPQIRYFEQVGGRGSELVTDLAQAAVFLSGDLRWDGCCNFKFDEQETCMLHTCGRADAVSIGELLGAIYDIAKEEMTSWDHRSR